MILTINKWLVVAVLLASTITFTSANQSSINPFERGGPKRPQTAPIVRPAPPPPAPIPINPNIEFRGLFKYQDEWHFSLFNKSTNKGAWIKKGESFDDGKVEIEDFNPQTDILKIKGGMTLSLIKSKNQVLPVPSGQPVKKKPVVANKPKVSPRPPVIPGNRARTISIPPRINNPPKK
jgi:hypothetical protein